MSFRPKLSQLLSSERIPGDAATLKNSGVALSNSVTNGAISYNSSLNTYKNEPFLVASIPNGLTLSWQSAKTVQVSPGFTVVNIGGRSIASLYSPVTKRIDQAWSIGSTNGGRLINFGLLTNTQTYHVFILYNPLTNATDLGFDNSIVASNRPTGWSARRIGSILIDINGDIIKFFQLGNYFEFDVPVVDLNSVEIPLAPNPSLYKLTVPNGLEVRAKINVSTGFPIDGYSDMPLNLSIQPTTDNPLTPEGSYVSASIFRGTIGAYAQVNTLGVTISELNIPTNINGEIQAQRSGYYYSSLHQTTIQTLGWTDYHLHRGR